MNVVFTTSEIYKRDSTGKVRIWYADIGSNGTDFAWRINSGIKDGKIVTSEWRVVEQKNVGRSNETSLEQQANLEAAAEQKKKLERGYFSDIKDIDSFEKIKPMLAAKYEDAKFDFDKEVYYSQPKLDGIRCIARADGLWSRAGKEIVAVPHISEALDSFFAKYPDVVLDGELYNHELKDDFNKITSLVRKTKPTDADIEEAAQLVQYHVYDVIFEDRPFSERINFVNSQNFEKPIVPVKTQIIMDQNEMDEEYSEYLADGYEGQMIRTEGGYQKDKRSKYLLKRKEFITEEYTVVGVSEGQGNWSGAIKRFHLIQADGYPFDAGVRGSYEKMKELFESGVQPEWATLRYFALTPDGVPRFPVVIDWGTGIRED